LEVCILILTGEGSFEFDGKGVKVQRKNIFEENPYVLSLPTNCKYKIKAGTPMEMVLIKTENNIAFKPRIFMPNEIRVEHRGEGLVSNTFLRLVRTVFDKSNHPESNLVIGEVVTLPGRWSSMPPHTHPHPEIYFYRFLPENGYGFSQAGEYVFKVHQNDIVKLLNGAEHPQVVLPGYAMWYLWVIKHLPNNPYIAPENNPEYAWVLDKSAKVWKSGWAK
jgi:5-deoxy-glucuronate isomerase